MHLSIFSYFLSAFLWPATFFLFGIYFLPYHNTKLVVGKAFAMIWDLYISFYDSANSKFTLLKDWKDIFRGISILVLVNKKVSLNNLILPKLFWSNNPAMTML